MIARADVRDDMLAKAQALVPASARVMLVYSLEEYRLLIANVPSIGLAPQARTFDDPTVIGDSKQSSAWQWTLYVAARGPQPGVPAGEDVESLLDALYSGLRGTEVLGLPGCQLKCVDEELNEMLATAVVMRQTWQHTLPRG